MNEVHNTRQMHKPLSSQASIVHHGRRVSPAVVRIKIESTPKRLASCHASSSLGRVVAEMKVMATRGDLALSGRHATTIILLQYPAHLLISLESDAIEVEEDGAWRHAIGNLAIALARHRLRIFEVADNERLDYRPASKVNFTTLTVNI